MGAVYLTLGNSYGQVGAVLSEMEPVQISLQ